MADTYSWSFYCLNCDWKGEFEVPKGIQKRDFAKNQKCPKCGTLKLSANV